jgi:hypothetical protein
MYKKFTDQSNTLQTDNLKTLKLTSMETENIQFETDIETV